MRTPFANKLSAGPMTGSGSIAGMAIRRFLVAAFCLVVAGCAAGNTTSTAPSQAALTPAPTPAQATDTQGSYRLVFELPRTDWRTTDSITGRATLSFIGTGGADLGGSGQGFLVFAFDEVGGSRHVGWALTADCRGYRLAAGQPMSSSIVKSGGYSGDAPPTDFNRLFFTDPLVHLPAGDWTITAVATFAEGNDCRGVDYTLKAPVLVHVTP
ncbi:MAG TPA: hypothetical protein VF371_07600 [Candidatus Limnocylindrales bacterium]